ncbi:unnamed protein product [Euphydryas editha]|uniref:PiggyBac transposable element-derived protein domain-containing protein n=1 Tax=Euphydryas editha TaxID=104508 RepID=A0AAU9TC74_EUPED|nr:unnamed protein product [Euphydryas editha]
MTKRSFNVAHEYRGLGEAIESILNDEEDTDVSYDIVAIPPDPSVLTDNEEGDEDDVQQNTLPHDIPGRVEVFESRNNDDWDGSDDEPLQRYRRVEIQEPRWRKCDGSYGVMISTVNNVQKRKENIIAELKDQTPLSIFEKIFDEEVFNMIILNTKLYALYYILFTYMLDLAVANSWRIHVMTAEDKLDQLQFRRSIARRYLKNVGIERRRRKPSSIVPGMSQDRVGHFPQKLPSQVRCVICHMKARWQCKKCIKTLCIEKGCFEKYHT